MRVDREPNIKMGSDVVVFRIENKKHGSKNAPTEGNNESDIEVGNSPIIPAFADEKVGNEDRY